MMLMNRAVCSSWLFPWSSGSPRLTMAETPFVAAEVPPELEALNLEGRELEERSGPSSAAFKVLCFLFATLWAGLALASACFIFPGLIMLPMAFDAPGSESDPRVYLSLFGMITFPCAAALSAGLACLCMRDGKLPWRWMNFLLALPVLNVLMIVSWS